MATEFLEVQSGKLELSDADLDLMAAGKFWGGSKRRPKKKPNWDKCQNKKIKIHGTYIRVPDCAKFYKNPIKEKSKFLNKKCHEATLTQN